jgi:CheY-like chemotaxis protein
MTPPTNNRRILLVDDHPPIHEDFHSILDPQTIATERFTEMESSFFGEAGVPPVVLPKYELESAFQGQEAMAKIEAAVHAARPFALAFMDVRMPPGWDGIETIRRLWDVDQEMQIVICTAYADYSWEEMFKRYGNSDRVVFLRKPFDHTEVRQLACTLTSKWNLGVIARMRLHELEKRIEERTSELTDTVGELQEALENVKTLSGLIPICAACKKIRDDRGFWSQIEAYVSQRTLAKFTHGMCPDCSRDYGFQLPAEKAQKAQ